MKLKTWIVLGLTLALVLDLGVFVGIGSSVGAISLTGGLTPTYTFQIANEGSNIGDGMSFNVQMDNINQSGILPLSAMLPGYMSTQVTFSLHLYSHGDCGNTGQPVWAPGVGADYGYYSIQYLVGGSATQFTAQIDGHDFTGTTITSTADPSLSANNSQANGISNGVAFCVTNNGQDAVSGNLKTPGVGFYPHTLSIIGQVATGTLVVAFTSFFTFCDGSLSGAYAVCNAASGALSSNNYLFQWDNAATGGGQLTTTSSVTVQSGISTVTVNNPGNLASNGGTISVTVSTGYAGSSGYIVTLLCPTPRSPGNGGCQGGKNDTRFSAQTVPSNEAAKVVTWVVPAGTSQAINVSGWNTWEVEITDGYFGYGYAPVTINIAPPGSPGAINNPPSPAFNFRTNGTFFYPSVGSTLTLVVYGNASNGNKSAAVVGVTLWIYYLQAGQNPVNEPSCGSQWVSIGCPYGMALPAVDLSYNGGNVVGTYTFTVTPPAGSDQIGVLAETFNTGQQGSPIVPYLVQITPAGCQPGMPGCPPNKNTLTIWELWGPILLSIAIILGAILLAIFVLHYRKGRYLWPVVIVVVAGAIVAVLYLTGAYTQAFAPGGFFDQGVG